MDRRRHTYGPKYLPIALRMRKCDKNQSLTTVRTGKFMLIYYNIVTYD